MAKPTTAPTGLAVVAGDGKLTISWNPLTASPAVDVYQVYKDDGWTQYADTAGTSYVMNGLTNGTPVKIRVGAHNADGYGPWSNPITATPTASAPPPPPLDLPAAVTGVVVTPDNANAEAHVDWTLNAHDEAVDEYEVSVTVRAKNATGYGPASPVVKATVLDPDPNPAPPPPDPDPDPDPPPPPSGLAPELQPFDPDHPVYVPAPTTKIAYKDSQAIVDQIVASKRGVSFDTSSESPPVYVGKDTDPIWTAGPYTFRAPANMTNSTGSDHPLIVLDKSSVPYGGFPVEYRFWQANCNQSTRVVTYSNSGVSPYHNDGRLYQGKRALGRAEIAGQNTGSGCSYSVGMVRPHEIAQGRIPHAMRIACSFPRSTEWFWPANRTENQAYASPSLSNIPMGGRIALDPATDLQPMIDYLTNTHAIRTNALARDAAITYLKALKEFGWIVLDGTTSSSQNTYFEGNQTAGWTAIMGPVNSSGSYNDIGRAVRDALNLSREIVPGQPITNYGWKQLYVIDPSVFDSHGR